MTPAPKRDEVEAVARAIYEARNKHLKNCHAWDDAGLDDEHPDYRRALYRDAKAAIAALERKSYRFPQTSCRQCGKKFGPGDHGFAHCDNHEGIQSIGE